MPTRGEQIAQALDSFLQSCSDVEGAAVVSVDGLPMASALPMHVEEDRLAAMAAAMLSLGEKASEGLSRGRLQELHLEGAAGTVHLMAAGPQAVFCAICRDGAKTGLVLFEMAAAAERIGAALAAPTQTVPAPAPVPAPVQAPSVPPVTEVSRDHAAPRPATRQPARQPVPVPPSVSVPTPIEGPAAIPAPPEGGPPPTPVPPVTPGPPATPTPARATAATSPPVAAHVSPQG